MTAIIPLHQAWLCLNCAAVSNSNTRCPGCAGDTLWSLERLLDRKPLEQRKNVA